MTAFMFAPSLRQQIKTHNKQFSEDSENDSGNDKKQNRNNPSKTNLEDMAQPWACALRMVKRNTAECLWGVLRDCLPYGPWCGGDKVLSPSFCFRVVLVSHSD